jgi:cytochrome bd-type quinol oxidase subunit 2
MAIACFGFVTILPLRPALNLPCFIVFISVSTFFLDEGEYFRVEDFFALPDFFLAAFLVVISFLLDTLMAERKEQVVCGLVWTTLNRYERAVE